MTADILPVNDERPDNCCQQYFVSSEGEATAMKKERKMGADDHSKPLSDVPVPGMRAVEICYTVEDVKLQEVELDHGPLKSRESRC